MFPLNTHIVVIDDMRGVRLLLVKILKELGFSHISEAENGGAALDVIKTANKTPAPVGLILCDLRMPVLDGLALLKVVRGTPELAHIPFIVLTAEAERDNIVNAMANDVSDYVIKPTNTAHLSKKLAQVWEKYSAKK